MRWLALCLGLWAAPLGGAAAAPAPRAGIIGGSPADGATYPATGMLVSAQARGGVSVDCTATLIRPDVALTAAHCIPDGYFGGLWFSLDPDARDGINAAVAVAFAHPHPSYRRTRTDTLDLTDADDLAVLILAEPVTAVMPELLDGITDEADVHPGVALEVVGYGVTKLNQQEPSGQKTTAEVMVDRIADYELDTTVAGPQPCYGDSGGPMFTAGAGARRLVGLVSRAYGAVSTCTSGAIATRVRPYLAWIDQAASDRSSPPTDNGDCAAGRGGVGGPLALAAILVVARRRRLPPAPIRGNDGR